MFRKAICWKVASDRVQVACQRHFEVLQATHLTTLAISLAVVSVLMSSTRHSVHYLFLLVEINLI